MADEVKAFLEEEVNTTQDSVSPNTVEKTENSFHMELEQEEQVENLESLEESPLFKERKLPVDKTFEKSAYEDTGKEFVTVNDTTVEITDEDKEQYLTCMLLEEPITLDIDLFGGRATITCRAITVYERDLIVLAGIKKSEELGYVYSNLYMDTNLQQLYMAMQITKVNGRIRDYLQFPKHEPGKMDEHAMKLADWSRERIETLPLPTWHMFARALNVFNHKLNKLNELALARNFTNPLD